MVFPTLFLFRPSAEAVKRKRLFRQIEHATHHGLQKLKPRRAAVREDSAAQHVIMRRNRLRVVEHITDTKLRLWKTRTRLVHHPRSDIQSRVAHAKPLPSHPRVQITQATSHIQHAAATKFPNLAQDCKAFGL